MPIKFDLSKYNNNGIVVETGTYMGDGVQSALDAGYKQVFSIELDKKRYENCKKRFSNNKNVTIIHGNSGDELPKLLKNINEPCTFWLDAHYCGEPLSLGVEIADKWCPMKEELEAINQDNIKTHTILIDDMRCIDLQHIEKKTQKPVGFPGKENLLKKIKTINENYKIEYLPGVIPDDVLVAYIND